ncbi:MAG TPA: YciI family protein [Bryobacteraceae bacterium]|nr:YciI family protein [Bryobacteraceae bacterium]
MPQYVLLLRDDREGVAGFSPEEMQKLIQRYGDWRRSLQNKVVGGQKLKDGEGHVLRKQAGKAAVTDGPFTEAKEVMGGFFIVEADNYNQVIELAKTCPHMDFGSIEVRAIERT